jgi:hypothetical protein
MKQDTLKYRPYNLQARKTDWSFHLSFGMILVMAAVLATGLYLMAGKALAADQVLTATVYRPAVVQTSAKTGGQYARIIIKEPRVLNGHSYTTQVPVMVFENDLLDKAMGLKAGDQFKAIAGYRSNEKFGEAYTIKQFLD